MQPDLDTRFDGETVAMVAQAIRDANTRAWPTDWEIPAHWYAVGALGALADSGRLLPPVVETREEWARQWDDDSIHACPYLHGEGIPVWAHGHTHRRTIRELSDGSTLVGPWRREDGTEK